MDARVWRIKSHPKEMNGPSAAGAGSGESGTTSPGTQVSKINLSVRRDIYLHMGHGNELPVPFNSRTRVPPGKIIVFFAEHASPVKSVLGDEIWREMARNPDLFQNPYASEIASLGFLTKVRVYRPGDLLPTLLFYPYLYSKDRLGRPIAYPSGAYKLESTKRPALPTAEATKFQLVNNTPDWNAIFSGEKNEYYREKLRKKLPSLQSVASPEFHQRLSDEFEEELNELVRILPDGIHYFVSCRLILGMFKRVQDIAKELYNELELLKTKLSPRNEGNRNTRNRNRTDRPRRRPERRELSYESILSQLSIQEEPIREYLLFAEEHSIPIPTMLRTIKSFNEVFESVDFNRLSNPGMTGEDYYSELLSNMRLISQNRPGTSSEFIGYFIEKVERTMNTIFGPIGVVRTLSTAQQQRAGKRTLKKRRGSSKKRRY